MSLAKWTESVNIEECIDMRDGHLSVLQQSQEIPLPNQEIKSEPDDLSDMKSESDDLSDIRSESDDLSDMKSEPDDLSDVKSEVDDDLSDFNGECIDNRSNSASSMANNEELISVKEEDLSNSDECVDDTTPSRVIRDDDEDLMDIKERNLTNQVMSQLPKLPEDGGVNEHEECERIHVEEMRQINEFCRTAGTDNSGYSDRPPISFSVGGIHNPVKNGSQKSNVVFPLKKVVRVAGRPLVIQNGNFNRVASAVIDGKQRKFIVVKALNIGGSSTVQQKCCSQSTPVTQHQRLNGSVVTASKPLAAPTSKDSTASICTHCVKEYNEASSQEMEKGKSVQVYFCNCCSRAFTSKKAKQMHERRRIIVNDVKEPPSLSCSYCDKTFKYVHSRRIHELTHTQGKIYRCQHCEASFATRSERKRHQTVHADERRFPCSFCYKLFKTNYCRAIHEKTHSQEIIPCSFCPRTFRNDTYRKRHEMLHTNDRPYKCDQCSKAFTRRSILNIHKLSHSGIRSVSCRFCDKKFIRKEHVQRHEKIHMNDRQYQCSFCPKRFITSDKARRHEKIHLRDMQSSSNAEDKTAEDCESKKDKLQKNGDESTKD